jgi:signal transduction histidine kinase
VYFCSLEALQNATKCARASRVRIGIARGDGELRFEVQDDGAGFDPETVPGGTGLQNMADCLAALRGTFEVRSAPGAGTIVAGRLPVDGEERG